MTWAEDRALLGSNPSVEAGSVMSGARLDPIRAPFHSLDASSPGRIGPCRLHDIMDLQAINPSIFPPPQRRRSPRPAQALRRRRHAAARSASAWTICGVR